jgi:hypothetical protein
MTILAPLAHIEIVLKIFGMALLGIKLDLVELIYKSCAGPQARGLKSSFRTNCISWQWELVTVWGDLDFRSLCDDLIPFDTSIRRRFPAGKPRLPWLVFIRGDVSAAVLLRLLA